MSCPFCNSTDIIRRIKAFNCRTCKKRFSPKLEDNMPRADTEQVMPPEPLIPEKKLGSVTVRAQMLVEFTHNSPWSPLDTIERLHRSALGELETAIRNDRGIAGRQMQILKVQRIISVSHEEDRT